MTTSLIQNLKSRIQNRPDDSQVKLWLRRWVEKIAIATLLLMMVGSATRVMNAGLACPDWPMCYGQIIPTQQMNFQVFLEWFHRLDAALIGLSTLALMSLSWWYRLQLPFWMPIASTFAFGLIIFQGILGGLTVTELLRFDLVTAHLGTALLFFNTLIVIALSLTPYPVKGEKIPHYITWVGLTAAILVYGQSLLGGLVASRWAVHQCLSDSQLCFVMNSHIFGVIPATLAILILVILVWRTPTLNPTLRTFAFVSGALVVGQILLGVATLRLHLQVEPLTVAHHTIGAILLGTLVAFTVISYQLSVTSE